MKSNLLLLVFLSLGLLANAQTKENRFSVLPTIGLTTPILDNGLGYHIGINPSYSLGPKFSIEGQVSYSHTSINSSFLSGDTGTLDAVNALVGGRFYFSSEEKKNRFYLNLLAGLGYSDEEKEGRERLEEFGLGLSIGAFIELNRVLIGLTTETPQNFVLKIGYIF